jgi:hypothetical protein
MDTSRQCARCQSDWCLLNPWQLAHAHGATSLQPAYLTVERRQLSGRASCATRPAHKDVLFSVNEHRRSLVTVKVAWTRTVKGIFRAGSRTGLQTGSLRHLETREFAAHVDLSRTAPIMFPPSRLALSPPVGLDSSRAEMSSRRYLHSAPSFK